MSYYSIWVEEMDCNKLRVPSRWYLLYKTFARLSVLSSVDLYKHLSWNLRNLPDWYVLVIISHFVFCFALEFAARWITCSSHDRRNTDLNEMQNTFSLLYTIARSIGLFYLFAVSFLPQSISPRRYFSYPSFTCRFCSWF